MKTLQKLLITILISILLLMNTSMAKAVPSLPSSFYGTVKIDGSNVSPGTIVSAWINGEQYAYTTVQEYSGDTVYSLDVPGDDPSTTGIIEGGVAGDTIIFKIGEIVADQTGSWVLGENLEKNITIEDSSKPSAIYIPLFIR